MDQYAKALEECGCDVKSLEYLRRWKSLNSMTSSASSSSLASASGAASGGGGNDYTGGGTKTVNMFSKLVAQSSAFVMEGVKNLVVKRHNLPVTKIVEELMEVVFNLTFASSTYFCTYRSLLPTSGATVVSNPL